MLSFGFQNINRTFFFPSKPINMLRDISFVFSLLLNTLFLLFFFSLTCNSLGAPILLYFNLEKHHLQFAFSSSTTFDLFYCLFLGFQTLNTYSSLCLFVDRVQKRNTQLSVKALTCKNISCTLFVVSLFLNKLFLPFSGISS